MKLKHTLLALGAAAALGFGSAANAIVYFGPGEPHLSLPLMDIEPITTIEKGTQLSLRDSGHMLILPYYNAQGGTVTLLSITNNDQVNGKALNLLGTGYLLGAILLLAPGDTWSATLSTSADGRPVLTTGDQSCLLPSRMHEMAQSANGASMIYLFENRDYSNYSSGVFNDLGEAAFAAQSREGSLEIHNMADIPPGSDLFKSIVHPRNCGSAAQQNLVTEEFVDAAGAARAGLAAATGGLSGTWMILNQAQVATYSGAMTAIRAEDVMGRNAYANIRFSPQTLPSGCNHQWGSSTWGEQFSWNSIENLTAAPLDKESNTCSWWSEVPNLSTPLIDRFASPEEQVEHITKRYLQSASWLRRRVENTFVSDPAGAVPMSTDWIVSQPLMNYYVSVTSSGRLLLNSKISSNPYKEHVSVQSFPDGGKRVCLNAGALTVFDSEGGKTTLPVPGNALCGGGEGNGVSVLSFAPDSVINASVNRTVFNPGAVTAGWASLDLGVELPILGYALTHFRNNLTDKNYGATMPHR